MCEKMAEIDRLIIYTEQDAEKIKEKFIKNLKWIKLDDETYQSCTFFLKIISEKNIIFIDVWEQDYSGRIVSKNNKFYHFFSLIQIRSWIKKWIKEINKYDPLCKIEYTSDQIKSNTNKLKSIGLTIIMFVLTLIIMLIISKVYR